MDRTPGNPKAHFSLRFGTCAARIPAVSSNRELTGFWPHPAHSESVTLLGLGLVPAGHCANKPPANKAQSNGAKRINKRFIGSVDYEVMRNFDDLSEREMLALAIALEEEDERIYADYAEGLREDFAASAAVFEGMRQEEAGHRRRLIELYRQKFGEHIPLIRRQDVKGFVQRKSVWLMQPLRLEEVRKQASTMEVESRQFYLKAAARSQRRRHPPIARRSGRRKNTRTRTAPRSWRKQAAPAGRQTSRRTRPAAACSCCRSFSPDLPG